MNFGGSGAETSSSFHAILYTARSCARAPSFRRFLFTPPFSIGPRRTSSGIGTNKDDSAVILYLAAVPRCGLCRYVATSPRSFEYRLHPVGSILAGLLFLSDRESYRGVSASRGVVNGLTGCIQSGHCRAVRSRWHPRIGAYSRLYRGRCRSQAPGRTLAPFGPVVDTVPPMKYCELQTVLNPVLPP